MSSQLALAAGVLSGSMLWAVLTATGVSALLAGHVWALQILQLQGGLYLLYLAVRAAQALRQPVPDSVPRAASAPGWAALYRQGVLLHIANPKAILAWSAIIALAMHHRLSMVGVLGACLGLGGLVFGGYAVVFSTASVSRWYALSRRWVAGLLVLTYAAAGLDLLIAGR